MRRKKTKPKVRKNKNTKKGKSRRSRTKFAELNPSLNLKTRFEEIEDMASYFDKLSDKDKAWLNQFAKEYVNANLKDAKLHKTKELKRDCYNRNNARNRCIWTKAKASGKTMNIDDINEDSGGSFEENVIEKIDEELFFKEGNGFDDSYDDTDQD